MLLNDTRSILPYLCSGRIWPVLSRRCEKTPCLPTALSRVGCCSSLGRACLDMHLVLLPGYQPHSQEPMELERQTCSHCHGSVHMETHLCQNQLGRKEGTLQMRCCPGSWEGAASGSEVLASGTQSTKGVFCEPKTR